MAIKKASEAAVQQSDSDSELDDIMNELDKLQSEIEESEKSEKPDLQVVEGGNAKSEVSGVEDFRASDDDQMDESLAIMDHDEPSADSPLEKAAAMVADIGEPAPEEVAPEAGVVEEPTREEPEMNGSTQGDQDGELSMTLTGKMKLHLTYNQGGQAVTVGFGDDYLKIEMSDGTEFKIPVARSGEKAA